MTGDLKSIKINSEVKKRLDFQKRRSTYSFYIEQMLSYFEMTGLEPKLGQVPPVATINKTIGEATGALYKRMDDMIKILRNIETTKIDVMAHNLETLKQGEINNTPEVAINFDNDEIYRVIQLNENLTKELETKNNLVQRLQKDIVNLKQDTRTQDVIDALEELLSDKVLNQDDKGNFILTCEYRNRLIEKIKTIFNVQ